MRPSERAGFSRTDTAAELPDRPGEVSDVAQRAGRFVSEACLAKEEDPRRFVISDVCRREVILGADQGCCCTGSVSIRTIKLTLLVTHSGIQDKRIEPIDSQIAAKSLTTAYANAESYRVIQYWRPIVPGLNDSDCHISRARELAEHAHATVYTGLFYRNDIRDYYRAHGIPEPYDGTARRKIFPEDLEERILAAFHRPDGTFGPLFRKTSCGVSYAHELPDYNGHYGIRELCDICPVAQIGLCVKALTKPDRGLVETFADDLGGKLIEINDRAVVVEGLTEQPRYLMQHSLGYQVHDVDKPHHQRQHGRADIGWPKQPAEPVGAST